MTFDPHIAATRFGTGLSPRVAPPESVAAMRAALTGPDRAAEAAPIDGFETHLIRARTHWAALRDLRPRRAAGDAEADAAIKAIRRERVAIRDASLRATLVRGMVTSDGLRERLTAFWADHFTTRSTTGPLQMGDGAFVEDAIRPRIAGRFADLLVAAVTHPVMVSYLDQSWSTGPNSKAAQDGRSVNAGLNENLAREVLELHTLGVDGPYDQRDVRQLATLFAGLGHSLETGRVFRPARAEPGEKTVLGRVYGGGRPGLDDIEAVLRDLAAHPATAAHLAHKLAVHFVSDTPAPALVAALRDAWRDTGGDLLAVTEALLTHPAAWDPAPRNVKPPLLFVTSALRALGTPPQTVAGLARGRTRRMLDRPLDHMGHDWQAPPGPDGLPEADTDWISPPALAARVQWALSVPERLGPLPDPRGFVTDAFGDRAPEPVRFAARAAETRREGIGLVLISPAFQRM